MEKLCSDLGAFLPGAPADRTSQKRQKRPYSSQQRKQLLRI